MADTLEIKTRFPILGHDRIYIGNGSYLHHETMFAMMQERGLGARGAPRGGGGGGGRAIEITLRPCPQEGEGDASEPK